MSLGISSPSSTLEIFFLESEKPVDFYQPDRKAFSLVLWNKITSPTQSVVICIDFGSTAYILCGFLSTNELNNARQLNL